jgi:3-deoxy-D-manno-octulosonic-acid transferase
MYFFYSLGLGLLLALASPVWLVRMERQGKYRAGLAERLGRVAPRLLNQTAPTSTGRTLWLHAVSVGEVLAIAGLVTEIRKVLPAWRVVVSTTTATGQKLAREKFGDTNVFYFPLDFAFSIRPYLRALRPEIIVLAETEFWPNLLRLGAESGAKIAVVNARISDRSFPRYRALRALVRPMLSNISAFLTQTDEDARRLIEIGATPARVEVGGNLKFDIKLPTQSPVVDRIKSALSKGGATHVIVSGSTVEGEESLVVEAFRRVLAQYRDSVMILAPRHPERFAAVEALLRSSGIRFWRRSQWDDEPLSAGIFLLDTIGELGSVYSLANIAFVGGSLVPRGGHNILEPAFFARPIMVGPHTENFRDIIAIFRKADALVVVEGSELGSVFLSLLGDISARTALGDRAAAVLKQHVGATARMLGVIRRLLDVSPAPHRANLGPHSISSNITQPEEAICAAHQTNVRQSDDLQSDGLRSDSPGSAE